MSLAIPFPKFNACWDVKEKDTSLIDFYQFLAKLPFIPKNSLEKLTALQPRLNSDIPRGYGLGSSGALCAAIYEYLFPAYEERDVQVIMKELAAMENYFHGKSSGLDPFVILFNQPVLKSQKTIVILDGLNERFLNDFYLVDSGVSRSSKSAIKAYLLMDKTRSKEMNELVQVNNSLVQNLVRGKEIDFGESIRKISGLQLQLFDDMIVPSIREVWENGLKSGEYFMKLCGAGSGGYYLVWGSESAIRGIGESHFSILFQ